MNECGIGPKQYADIYQENQLLCESVEGGCPGIEPCGTRVCCPSFSSCPSSSESSGSAASEEPGGPPELPPGESQIPNISVCYEVCPDENISVCYEVCPGQGPSEAPEPPVENLSVCYQLCPD